LKEGISIPYILVENAEKVNIFTFLSGKTDNIMDYTENGKRGGKRKILYFK
jgi:hypothetical protein